MTHLRTPILIALVAVVAAACSGGDEASDTTPSPATTTVAPPTTARPTTTSTAAPTTSTSTSTTTTLPPVPREPLTGEVLDDTSEITPRPALAVKIDNHPSARRNHSGLGLADLVFEEIVEGGLTRFAAVFHTNDADPVGPIRSGRSQDVDLLTSFGQPLFAWSGGNPGVTRLIADSTLTDLNWQKNGGSYYRGDGSAPHNLYSSTETLFGLTPDEHPGPPPQQFDYIRPGETFGGESAIDRVDVDLASIPVSWEWDAELGEFRRSQVGDVHVDVLDGPITARNVVLMVVEYRPSQIDARSPEAQTIGGGPVFVLSDGMVAVGRWLRESADEPIGFVDPSGESIELVPGSTWIELVEAIGTDDPANPDAAIEFEPPLD